MTTPDTPPVALKACPFCGGEWALGQEPHDNHPVQGMWYLYHKSPRCFWNWSPPHFSKPEEAIAAWNQRATPDAAGVREAWHRLDVELGEIEGGMHADLEDAASAMGDVVAGMLAALPLASTEAGIGAGEGATAPSPSNVPQTGNVFTDHPQRGFKALSPPAALDEHRARAKAVYVDAFKRQYGAGKVHFDVEPPAYAIDAMIEFATSPRAAGDRLREALEDLVSWFPENGPTSFGPWIIKAGEYGADDAVNEARAALRSDDGEAGRG